MSLVSAALKLDSVDTAFVVDNCSILELSGSVGNLYRSGGALSCSLNLCVYFGLFDLANRLCCLNALVVLDGYLGLGKVFAGNRNTLVIYVAYLDLGLADHLDAGLLNSFLNILGKNVIERVLIKNSLAVHLLNDASRSLALSEAGDGNLGSFLLEDLGYRLVEILLGNKELNRRLIGFCFGYIFQTHFLNLNAVRHGQFILSFRYLSYLSILYH